MPYEKQTWVDYIIAADTGEVLKAGTSITAARLNHMEDGISQMSQSFESFTADSSEGATLGQVETTVQTLESSVQSVQTTIQGIQSSLNSKVDKVAGKGLSTNDLTNALVTKINESATTTQLAAALERLTALEQWKADVLAGTTSVAVET